MISTIGSGNDRVQTMSPGKLRTRGEEMHGLRRSSRVGYTAAIA